MRVLAAALRGHRSLRAFQDLQQRLLYTLAGDVAGDRRVFALAGDLVDLVDVDDAGLGTLHVVVGRLNQLEEMRAVASAMANGTLSILASV
ncbi:Uncharacterised protein [Mycobacteroides abscessus subsp. massiliense]|nr:Uncharacterised protein [Mycobacteroides abscessus subsp. massiliense]